MFTDWRFWFALLSVCGTSTLLIFKAGAISRDLKATVDTVEEHDGRITKLERSVSAIETIKRDIAEIKQVQKDADKKRESSRETYIAEITEIKTCMKFIKRELKIGKSTTA
jgi:hypothetical protein